MPMRRRRPLLRTAAVAGGAAYAGKKYGEKKEYEGQREAEQEARIRELEAQQAMAAQQQAAPPPPSAAPAVGAGAVDDTIEQLRKLGELRDAGILTEEEFAAQKAKLLG